MSPVTKTVNKKNNSNQHAVGHKKGTASNKNFFEKFAVKVTSLAGSSYAFTIALGAIVVWLLSGPIFNYSDTWQLIINTGTTIITFLMVFLIQKSQNKESKAIQLKLNELIAANEYTSNRMVAIEDLTEAELDVLIKYYKKLSEIAKKDNDIHQSHSIDAAVKLHEEKQQKKTEGRKTNKLKPKE